MPLCKIHNDLLSLNVVFCYSTLLLFKIVITPTAVVLPVVCIVIALAPLHRRREVPNLEFFATNIAFQIKSPSFFVRCRIPNWVRIQISVSTLIFTPKVGTNENPSADETFYSIFTSNWSSSPNFGPKLVFYGKRWGSRPLTSAVPSSPPSSVPTLH